MPRFEPTDEVRLPSYPSSILRRPSFVPIHRNISLVVVEPSHHLPPSPMLVSARRITVRRNRQQTSATKSARSSSNLDRKSRPLPEALARTMTRRAQCARWSVDRTVLQGTRIEFVPGRALTARGALPLARPRSRNTGCRLPPGSAPRSRGSEVGRPRRRQQQPHLAARRVRPKAAYGLCP